MQQTQIGIDLGTTTISLVVLDSEKQTVLWQRTEQSRSNLSSEHHALQNPAQILLVATKLLEEALTEYPNTTSIGLTGQMHGILYLNAAGEAVSPLYTWQDCSADTFGTPVSFREQARQHCGKTAPNGYGLLTHYVLQCTEQLPKHAVGFCSIADYLGMRLTGRKNPLLHTSMAASFGFFSVTSLQFELSALHALQIDASFLPPYTAENTCLGLFGEIPVSIALGDNQAAFFGAVEHPEVSVLVNVGTGSQICLLCDHPTKDPALETRPFLNHRFLCSYSALCGGYAYAILEGFFRSIAREMTGKDASQYELMGKWAASEEIPLDITTTFQGTRLQPELRGSIQNLSADNFTPHALVRGVLAGIVEELYEKLEAMPVEHPLTTLVTSGNGIRKNPVLQQFFSSRFQLPLALPECAEEAAIGAARFGALCSQAQKNLS